MRTRDLHQTCRRYPDDSTAQALPAGAVKIIFAVLRNGHREQQRKESQNA
jgi:hypothetical protein